MLDLAGHPDRPEERRMVELLAVPADPDQLLADLRLRLRFERDRGEFLVAELEDLDEGEVQGGVGRDEEGLVLLLLPGHLHPDVRWLDLDLRRVSSSAAASAAATTAATPAGATGADPLRCGQRFGGDHDESALIDDHPGQVEIGLASLRPTPESTLDGEDHLDRDDRRRFLRDELLVVDPVALCIDGHRGETHRGDDRDLSDEHP